MKGFYITENKIKLLYILLATFPIVFIGIFIDYMEYNWSGYVLTTLYSIGFGWYYTEYIYEKKWFIIGNVVTIINSVLFAFLLLKNSNWHFQQIGIIWQFIVVTIISLIVQLITIYIVENIEINIKK